MRLMCCPETSEMNYQSTQRNFPEQQRPNYNAVEAWILKQDLRPANWLHHRVSR